MKTHGKVDKDGKRYGWVWIDPDGGYILEGRVGTRGSKRMNELPEYRFERYEMDERGRIIGSPPAASPEHQEMRSKRIDSEKRKTSKRPKKKAVKPS